MRFRIDRPIRGRRGARIVGLDWGADQIVERVAGLDWGTARFFSLEEPVGEVTDGGSASVMLRNSDGALSSLLDELADADLVVMVGTTESDASAATVIGAACTVRRVMTAGLIIGQRAIVGDTVTALRPHARVLMVTDDEQDVIEVLRALRA
jgi:hypothetical protein